MGKGNDKENSSIHPKGKKKKNVKENNRWGKWKAQNKMVGLNPNTLVNVLKINRIIS